MGLHQLGAILVVCCLLKQAVSEPGKPNTLSLTHIANVSYADDSLSGIASVFSPRMDFDQWKPLTGRGDPLRNDPTYDYEPPVLERVRYWADETRFERDHYPERDLYPERERYPEREFYPEREHYPERKSEVLMLGVSSRKPSVAPRHPPPRKHHRPPPPNKYEDYSYKLGEHYPMTILVPPPLPPPGHKSSLFVLDEERLPNVNAPIKFTDSPKLKETTITPEHVTSLYALQEANLIYQSSSVTPNWIMDPRNKTTSLANSAVSSDYAGWGPTTPIDEPSIINDTHNFISNDYLNVPSHPYSFYKPILSEAPPPPRITQNPLLLPTFVPTALPPLASSARPKTTITTPSPATWPTEQTTTEASTFYQEYYEDTTTDMNIQTTQDSMLSHNTFDMLNPMLSMPLVNGPERPEDNLYAHASENLHVFKEQETEDNKNIEIMQSMQPPPVTPQESVTTSAKNPVHISNHNNMPYRKPTFNNNLDPYLHMRFTTPMHTVDNMEKTKTTTEPPTVPKYLIIQGHSKVKTYGSKPREADDSDTINNEISKPRESTEVKHLHPIKEKFIHKSEKADMNRKGKGQNLNSLLKEGRGSIEIQETDVGIKYDVSDGSEVPIEIYRKGIVDNDENDYSSKRNIKANRTRRQIDLEDILPFDEDTIEEYVYDFLKNNRNDTGITGLIAQAVNSKAASVIDELEEEDDDEEEDQDNETDR